MHVCVCWYVCLQLDSDSSEFLTFNTFTMHHKSVKVNNIRNHLHPICCRQKNGWHFKYECVAFGI